MPGCDNDTQCVASISFNSAYHQLRILSDHVPCKDNLATDALSYNNKFSPLLLGSPLIHSTSTAGHTAPQLSRLDLTKLEADVQPFFERGLAPSTTCTYQLVKWCFILFVRHLIANYQDHSMQVFLVYLANQKFKHRGLSFRMRAGDFTCPTNTHFDPESMLSPEDVSVDQHQSPSLLCMKLQCSKTDPLVYPYSWDLQTM